MTEAICPRCGGQIELIATSNPPQIPPSNPPQIDLNASNLRIGFGSKDLPPKSESRPKSKSYNQNYTAQFEQFWGTFPLHRGKRKAFENWLKAVERLASNLASNLGGTVTSNRVEAMAQILAGAQQYRDDMDRNPEVSIKYAEGWLAADRWEDEPLPVRISPNGRRPADPPRPLTSGEMDRMIERGRRD